MNPYSGRSCPETHRSTTRPGRASDDPWTAASDRRQPDHLLGRVGVLRTVSAVVAGCLLVVACGTDPPSGVDRAIAEAAIHAAVTRQLVEFNNTFGPDHRFTEVLIVDHLETQAGDGEPEGGRGASLTDGQRSAIRAAVEHLAPVRFIDNRRAYIRQDVLQPTIPGSVIITLGPVEFDNEGATVGADLWCGGVCGLRLTYRLTEEPDGWTVTGTEGPWSIS